MPGRGPVPKAPGARRNRHAPQRGEWTSFPALKKPVLPALPKRTRDELPWSQRAKDGWKAWREDPATGMYGAGEIQDAIDLLYVYEQWIREGTAALAREVRQRKDDLGLSMKGKQERRWRVADREVVDDGAAPADVVPLRVVRGRS